MRLAALDSRLRARLVAVALSVLAALVAWSLVASDRPERAAAQTGVCAGDGTATLTVNDNDNDGAAEASTDTVIPASCDIGLRTDGRTARYWSIDVYDAGDATKRYFCHRGTDAPPGEPSCDTPQPTNPTPDSDVSAAIVKENGIWRLYVHLNTRVPSHTLTLRAHYAWKGTGGTTDQCPSEPGTGPCMEPPPGAKYDLALNLDTPRAVAPRARTFMVKATVTNKSPAQADAPRPLLSSFFDTRGLAPIDHAEDVKTEPTGACKPHLAEPLLDCLLPDLPRGASTTVTFQVPAIGDQVDSNAFLRGAGTGLTCREVEEVTCADNNRFFVRTAIPTPDTDIEQPKLEPLEDVFFEGSSKRSTSLEVASAHAAAAGPRVGRVEIALLRKQGKARAVATPRCLWMRNGKAEFKRVKAGEKNRCDAPVWLRARGTARWRFRGSKALPKGRYVVYARAIDRAGHTASTFTKRRKNRREFEVG